MNVCMLCFYRRKGFISSLENQCLLNFNCIVLIIKLAEGLEMLLSEKYLYKWNSHFSVKSLLQHPETILIILLYLYQNIYTRIYTRTLYCVYSCIKLIKGLRYLYWRFCVRVYSSMRSYNRNDIQHVKSVWLICIQSLKHSSYSISREIIRNVKQTHIAPPRITQFSRILN